jgi:hypothetical protein
MRRYAIDVSGYKCAAPVLAFAYLGIYEMKLHVYTQRAIVHRTWF